MSVRTLSRRRSGRSSSSAVGSGSSRHGSEQARVVGVERDGERARRRRSRGRSSGLPLAVERERRRVDALGQAAESLPLGVEQPGAVGGVDTCESARLSRYPSSPSLETTTHARQVPAHRTPRPMRRFDADTTSERRIGRTASVGRSRLPCRRCTSRRGRRRSAWPGGGTQPGRRRRWRPRPSTPSAPRAWSARPYENDSCHGCGPSLFIASRCAVASSSLWPPERNTMPGTAAGTRRGSTATVASATSSTDACCRARRSPGAPCWA